MKILSLGSPHGGKPPLAPLTDRNKPAVWAATPREAGWIFHTHHSNHTYHTDHTYCHIKHTIPNRLTYHTYHPYNTNHSCHTYHTYHTYQTYHTFQTCHTRPTIHTIHTQHTIPHPHHTTGGGGGQCHTPTTPQGGEGEDLIWGQYMGPIPWEWGGGGVAGPGAYIYIYIYTADMCLPYLKGLYKLDKLKKKLEFYLQFSFKKN